MISHTGIMLIDATKAIMSLSLVGGLGAILDIFFIIYTSEGRSVNQVVWLSTFPSLFVGIGWY